MLLCWFALDCKGVINSWLFQCTFIATYCQEVLWVTDEVVWAASNVCKFPTNIGNLVSFVEVWNCVFYQLWQPNVRLIQTQQYWLFIKMKKKGLALIYQYCYCWVSNESIWQQTVRVPRRDYRRGPLRTTCLSQSLEISLFIWFKTNREEPLCFLELSLLSFAFGSLKQQCIESSFEKNWKKPT